MRKLEIEVKVGFFVLLGLLCVAYMTFNLGKVSLWGDDAYRIYARFNSVSGLKVGSPVEIFGILVGKVERLTLDSAKQMALVSLKIQKGTQIYDDGIASIRR